MSTEFSLNEKRMLRHLLLTKGMYFSRYFFKKRESRNFIVNSHHILLDNVMDRVYSGEIKRLIINMPPGYTKTEEAVIIHSFVLF
jgi:hypothetical protein